MALLIIATVDKPIIINGTTVSIPSVYDRLAYVAEPDGVTMEVANYIFQDASFFDQGLQINTDLPKENLRVTIDIALGEQQNLAAAEKYAKIAYESLGFQVEILA
jgi:hypothetical protein